MFQKCRQRARGKQRIRLQTRMLGIYLIGGLIPMLLTCLFLIHGTSRILIRQTRSNEFVELQNMKRELLESLNNVAAVSQYFYFDQDLEKIAFHRYNDYQELVDDYQAYGKFQTYENYYSQVIRWICIYLENPTISGNARFVEADEEVRESSWYPAALQNRGRISWEYMENSTDQGFFLSLIRTVRTSQRENVGVLVIHVRPEWIREFLSRRGNPTCIFLDGRQLLGSSEEELDQKDEAVIRDALQGMEEETFSGDIKYRGGNYELAAVSFPLPESENAIQIVSLQSRKRILSAALDQARGSFLFLAVSIAVSLAMIIKFSHGFSRRVDCFRLQMQKAASGSFDLEAELGGNDEISELYGYLGNMIYSLQHLLSEIYQEQLQKEKLKRWQKDAQFKVLASQINPHFLYNTLEIIRMTARDNQQSETEELIKMLAKLLRRNIQAGNRPVTLQSEIELLEYYLKIQQYRFGDRIQYAIEMEPGLESCKILPLLMQPLAENAIIHGLEAKLGTGHVWIWVSRQKENIQVVMEDDGEGIEPERLKELHHDLDNTEELDRTHIGICNVHQRIRLMYGEAYGLHIENRSGGGTRAEFQIPMDEEGKSYGSGSNY